MSTLLKEYKTQRKASDDFLNKMNRTEFELEELHSDRWSYFLTFKQWAENLEMARLHIDLLEVLRQKTAGNLTAQEAAILEDLIYRLRMRYVQKRG